MSKRKTSEVIAMDALDQSDPPDILAGVSESSEGWPVETETDYLDEAVAILRECHPFVTHDMLAQRVHAFVKAHK